MRRAGAIGDTLSVLALSTEPLPTAILLALFGVLLATSVLLSRSLERLGVPVVLLFLVLGMLAGSQGIGGVGFADYGLAFRLGSVALVLILFDGGLNTSLATIRRSILPASVLATVGVGLTAGLVALGGRMFGLSWRESLLLGAVVSSTDAATVFAVLRGSRLSLKPRVGATLELESGLNDPMAVILTITLTAAFLGAPTGAGWWPLIWTIPLQLAIGAGAGIAIGYLTRWVLSRVHLTTTGLYPILTMASAFLAFGLATIFWGSGFMAVYVAGIVLGNGVLPYRSGLTRVHDAVAWLCQISMFLMLGLLVFPRDLPAVAPAGLGIAIFLAIVARPLAVLACLAPFRYPRRELAYVGWVGLRGAVPIILATYPVLSGVAGSERIFTLVFFVVVVSTLIPGATIRWLANRLGLIAPERPTPAAILEINSARPLGGELLSFYIDPSLAVSGAAISQIRFPPGSSALLLVRGGRLESCRGETVLRPGDHIYIFTPAEHRPFIELLFGRAQDTGGAA